MMRRLAHRGRIPAFLRDDDGATLVEFAIVISLFLLIFFSLIDFGRLAYHIVTAERAMHAAARVAAVRPAVCPGLPEYIAISGSPSSTADYGMSCNAGGSICQDPGTISCVGDASNPTAAEVWAQVRGVLPGTATIANLRFTYAYDARLSFLGGPYVPVLTVELENVTFEFVTPLSALAVVAGATPGGTVGNDILLPNMSVSLPAEDLAQGENG